MPYTMTATVTAKCGPAEQVTAQVFSGLSGISVDLKKEVIRLHYGSPEDNVASKEFDLHGVTTVTDTVTAGNHAVTIS